MKPKRKRWLIVAAIIGLLLLWAGFDLFGPRRADLRRFNPNEVAHLDAVMWRSYYNRNPRQLFLQLAELMRRQFQFPLLKSNEVAAYAARAAFVFKDGHNRADYEKALPDLEKYSRRFATSAPGHSTSGAPRDWNSNGGLFIANASTTPTAISRVRWPKPPQSFIRCQLTG